MYAKPIQPYFIDHWTLPHMYVGACLAMLGMDAKNALFASLSWEAVENLLIIPNTQWHKETRLNILGDIAANMAGFAVISTINRIAKR